MFAKEAQEDTLLYALSSLKEISWLRYKELFGNLYVRRKASQTQVAGKIEHLRFRTLKALASLGHCDFYFESGSGRIYSAPSVLARLPVSGFPKAVLCGSRGPDTITRLAQACKSRGCEYQVAIQTHDPSTLFIPLRIVVESDDICSIAGVAKDLEIRFVKDPPSWALSNYAPSLTEYLKDLIWEREQPLDWQREDFDPHRARFTQRLEKQLPSLLSRYKDPIRGTNRYFFSANNRRAQIDVEWGRYAALQSVCESLLIYDAGKFTLAIPVTAPLPSILARSAVLCTGYVTRAASAVAETDRGKQTGIFEIYEGIPEVLAKKIAEKLDQHLMFAQLRISDEEQE